ncbi:MAG TPA: bifunctional folylpolyglutamate synthase/dihydrofolate synthase [Acholeplasmataceae bacterium]|jgi:dihydrofolate synthase/folylpolyglutamate synthase|nr:bifunctional folylpolyglutamate synthase/dihydrofolate synthase [Acholeplasmataceae bacterium]
MFTDTKELVAWIETQKRLVPKVSLERMRRLCATYGNPQEGLKYIHVGGTNGKGSTVSYLTAILRSAGYNVGMFISPYVDVFNERIACNGRYISDAELLDIGNYIIAKYPLLDAEDIPRPSFFEFMTLMAFVYFSRLPGLDYVILEVGLGGLLDATNIITPLVTVIASISYDHEKILGSTLSEIAANKLGIVKPGVPLVAIRNDEVLDMFISVTREKQSELFLVANDELENVKATLEATEFDYRAHKGLRVNLLGFHQAENAALAVRTAEVLRDKCGISLTDADIRAGLLKAKWPGRLQLISKEPPVLLDGAHNPGGISRLVEFLRAVKGERFLRIVFAASADKDKPEMIALLDEIADEIVFTRFGYKRSDAAENLYCLSRHPRKRIVAYWRELFASALNEKGTMTVFCGSLYFVSEIYNHIKSRS